MASEPSDRIGGEGRSISQAGELRSARIESLRAVAALAVLFSHAWGFANNFNFAVLTSSLPRRVLFGGGAAVFLFFALTGYLLFLPFARRQFGDGKPIDLRRYALNRALRILPLYYVVLVVVLITLHHGGSLRQWGAYLVFGENFFASTVGAVDGPMWSLVVELHFYILLPFIAWALARLARRSSVRAAVLLALPAVATLVARRIKVDNGRYVPDPRIEFSLLATFGFFYPGMALALLRVAWEKRLARWLRGPLAHGDLWLLASVPVWVLAVDNFKHAYLCAPAAFLTVGACVLPLRTGLLVGALQWRPLAALGVASYSLYLWHVPIVEAFHHTPAESFASLLAISLVVSIAVSLLSYRFIEAPFLRLRRRWSESSPAAPPGPAHAQPTR